MAFAVNCECGAAFNLKGEYAGKLLQCPTCKKTFIAQSPAPIATVAQADTAFAREKFLLRQKVMTISEKYEVGDEQNRPILFVERPAHLLRMIGAALVGFVAFVIMLGLCIFVAAMFEKNETLFITLAIVGVILGVAAALCVGISLSPKRHVSFYRNPSKTEKLLDVLQDAKFQPINATYTVRDRDGHTLCTLHKNIIYNFIRKRWYCYAPDGSMICMAKEDSVVLSLLRRFLGPMFGLLRTNFIITPPDSEQVIAEFNRKFTLFDRYVLDLSMDPGRTLDRRIALAMGVMLDTGERR